MARRFWILVFPAVCLFATTARASADNAKAERTATERTIERDTANARGSLGYEPPAWPDPPNTGAMLARLAAGTVSVLVLCAGTLWIGRRWLRGVPPQAAADGQLRLLESVSLGNRAVVYLLVAGQHQIIVGADASGMKSMLALPESFGHNLVEAQARELPTEDTTSTGADAA
jgi:flagellar biogenesis protein FliO